MSLVTTRLRLAATVAATLTCSASALHGQVDTTVAQGGPFDRPFIASVASASIGGYVEGNTNYFVEEGVGEGFSMELRRFNIFLFSQISRRVRFLSELEFEHGTEEIALETALVDVRLHPSLSLRGGIVLPPIGYLNQNHDSPRWDFVERPLVTTEIIPSTLSEVGFGIFGRIPVASWSLSYDAYLTNGLGDRVVGNATGRTHIPSGKTGDSFAQDNNGSPAVSGRLAARIPRFGEVGVSYYGGHYNSYRVEGVEVDERRWLGIAALDLGATVGPVEVRAEAARATIDVPAGMTELLGHRQRGGHVDVTVPVWRPRMGGYEDAVVSAGLRLEHIDYNVGVFSSTGRDIGDEVTAVVPGVSFRPSDDTVFRVNYRYGWTTDLQGNEPSRRAGFQVGFATYF